MDFLMMDAANAAQQPAAGGALIQLLPFILIFGVMYFLMIRPQKKKQQEHQKMLDNLQVHDKIITNGGIIGKVVNIKKEKNTIVVRVDETTNTKIEFQRSAIGGVINEEAQTKNSSN